MTGAILARIIEQYRRTEKYHPAPLAMEHINLRTFSPTIRLYDYQQEALRCAVDVLRYYYRDGNAMDGQKQDILQAYHADMGADKKTGYQKYLNRAGFWMATGSGKSIVMVKLLQVLHSMMRDAYIPTRNILVLAPRAEIMAQIQEHIAEFNTNGFFRIYIHDLRSIERGQRELYGANEMHIYTYRSDLISDADGVSKKSKKGRRVDYRNFLNAGKWYIILDEAHKGDTGESKRQEYYRAMTEDGYLFNFSATFTDAIDIATTAYNFNLERFISAGYGKNIKITDEEFKGFNKKIANEWEDNSKEDIILKSIIVFSAIKKARIDIGKQWYHNPLMMCVAGKVNTDTADLKLFFRVINRLATHNIASAQIKEAAEKLAETLSGHPQYQFCDGDTNQHISTRATNIMRTITAEDIMTYFFNAAGSGEIEYSSITGNKREIIFKLKNATEPFALLVIGEAKKWEVGLLQELALTKSDEIFTQSFFADINSADNPVNMLMGSHIFSEGWDSNRPNIVNFLNIGSREAKKYVLQTLGRGVRIEPVAHMRMRYDYIPKEKAPFTIDDSADRRRVAVELLESLFVFATRKDDVRAIFAQLDVHTHTQKRYQLGDVFQKQPPLLPQLMPEYKEDDAVHTPYPMHTETYKQMHALHHTHSRKVIALTCLEYATADTDDSMLNTLDAFNPTTIDKAQEHFVPGGEAANIAGYERAYLRRIDTLLRSKPQRCTTFRTVTAEDITHYEHITVARNTMDTKDIERLIPALEETIAQWTRGDPQQLQAALDTEEKQLDIAFDDGDIDHKKHREHSKRIMKERRKISMHTEAPPRFMIDFAHIKEHYYVPFLLPRHSPLAPIFEYVIHEPSEQDFIKKLEKYGAQKEHALCNVPWSFSKINEHLDSIHIPYFDTDSATYRLFYPDFIFWIQKEGAYYIIFVDPKGLVHERGARDKVNGFREIFGDSTLPTYEGASVRVQLWLYSNKQHEVGIELKPYVSNDFDTIFAMQESAQEMPVR